MAAVAFKDADWQQKIRYMNEYDNFARLYGVRLVEYAPGFARLQMQVDKMHLNSQGRIHGGWLSGLLIIAGSKAARSYGQEVQIASLTMNYCRNVSEGVITVTATEKYRNAHTASYQAEMHTAEGRLLTAGVVSFELLKEEVSYHLLPPPTAEWYLVRESPIWPEERADLHTDIAGLRPCFSRADWPVRRQYMNENENLFYAEGITVTDFGPGLCRAYMKLLPRHFDARGLLEPACIAMVLDPTMGKPSLSGGEFSVTAQMSIDFYGPSAAEELVAEGRERTRGEHFGVSGGEIWDESGRLLATGSCTMFLRHSEIDFRREHPLNYPEGPEGA